MVKFNLIMGKVAKWFAHEANNYKEDKEFISDLHINTVLCERTDNFNDEFLRKRNFVEQSEELVLSIIQDDYSKLRGKFIIDGLVRIFHRRPTGNPKYNDVQLFNIFICLNENEEIRIYFKNVFDALLNTPHPPKRADSTEVLIDNGYLESAAASDIAG